MSRIALKIVIKPWNSEPLKRIDDVIQPDMLTIASKKS